MIRTTKANELPQISQLAKKFQKISINMLMSQKKPLISLDKRLFSITY